MEVRGQCKLNLAHGLDAFGLPDSRLQARALGVIDHLDVDILLWPDSIGVFARQDGIPDFVVVDAGTDRVFGRIQNGAAAAQVDQVRTAVAGRCVARLAEAAAADADRADHRSDGHEGLSHGLGVIDTR